jgi:hypothetical protein
MKQRVFISYNYSDKNLVPTAIRKLQSNGLLETESNIEIDDPANWSATGEDVRSILKDRIRTASKLVLLWSVRSAKSPLVQYELGMAYAFEIPVLVVLVGEDVPSLPLAIAESQMVRIKTPSA